MKECTGMLLCLALIAILFAFLCGCTQPSETTEGGRLVVAVTIPPQEEMVRAIAGDRVEVLVMIPPGSDPHTYEPTPQQILGASRASLYFTLGNGLFPIEDTLQERLRALNPDLIVVDSSQGVEYLGAGTAPDPHVWLSLRNGATMAGNMRDAFISADPAHESLYRSGSEAYTTQIEELDGKISGYFAEKKNRTIVVSHPAWGYFARDYNLSVITIEEEGKEPTPKELAGLVDRARESGVTVIFADALENRRDAEVIAREIGATVETVNPLAPDYLANMDRTARAFARSLPG
jgi:zinc transport system substrate-binding protein